MDNQLISVIVPCYNQGQYLADALNSVFAQTYPNWECIIVNDGSTDDTEAIAYNFLKKDARFKYTYKKNGGLSSARNAGLQVASGTFIQFLDADDTIEEEKFHQSINILKEDPACELIISNFKCYDERLKKLVAPFCNINRKIDLDTILKCWDAEFSIPIHCALIKRRLLSAGFNEELKAKEDWLMWISIFMNETHYRFLDKEYAIYRLHNKSMTQNEAIMEKNLIKAYLHIYHILDKEFPKEIIFNRLANDVNTIIQRKNDRIEFYRKSYSYTIGHYLLSPLKLLKKLNFIGSRVRNVFC